MDREEVPRRPDTTTGSTIGRYITGVACNQNTLVNCTIGPLWLCSWQVRVFGECFTAFLEVDCLKHQQILGSPTERVTAFLEVLLEGVYGKYIESQRWQVNLHNNYDQCGK
jgi:hypothetical protein